jgi:RNA polymerase sigma factor (sigma-70 family)
MPGFDEASDAESLQLLARWQKGDQQAATLLFQRHAARLVLLARSQLSAKLAHRVDPEDVVQSVYRSFFVESREGRYQLEHGGDLWQLLVTMTIHKLTNAANRLGTQKRALARERTFGSEDSLFGLGAPKLARAPSVEEAVALADLLEEILRALAPPQRRIVEMRLQGYNLDEIAAEIPCSLSTVRRVLERIKEQLEPRQDGNGAS